MDWEFIAYMNPHWEKNYFYNYQFERKALKEVLKEGRLIKLITGPRRVGKTVMLKQVIDKLIKKGVKREKILYVLLEEKSENIVEIVKEWSKRFGINLREKTYVFIDEVQYRKNWSNEVKLLYDTFENMRIYLSGSSSSLIKNKSSLLAGRMKSFFIKPFDFEEYLGFYGKEYIKHEEDRWEEYKKYLFKQLPELKNVDAVDYVKSIVEKVVGEDVRKLFSVGEEDIVYSLIRIVFKQPGQMIDYNEMAKELGVDRGTISKYFHALESSFLLRKVYSFSKSVRKSERRKKKFYPFYTTLLHYISPYYPDFSYILETDVGEKLDASFYFYEKGKEVDFVLPECRKAIEVKTSKIIDKSSLKTLISLKGFEKKYVVAPPYSKVKGVKRILPFEVERIKC